MPLAGPGRRADAGPGGCRRRRRAALAVALSALSLVPAAVRAEAAPAAAILSDRDVHHPVYGRHGMVVTQEAHATRVGVEILERGGNAVDAAVAVGFALAVTLPRAGNLGGGGFMMIYRAAADGDAGRTIALDYRETAPAQASRDMFLGADGEVDEELARFSHRSAGVPGTVAGLAKALAEHGTMRLAEVLQPAIQLAERGFVVSPELAASLEKRRQHFARWPASAAIFLRPDGEPWQAGDRLVQTDLGWSLRRLAELGPRAFYDGPVGARLVADMERHGGLIRRDDLRAYRAVERQPLRGTYRGYEVVSMPPPSSGGVHLIQMLNLLEAYPLAELGAGSAATLHLMAEAMKLAFADRARHLGDPDFWPVPARGLTSKAYAASLRSTIDPYFARPSSTIAAGDPAPYESAETTHFSIADRWGNAVSNTYTINFSYGSGIVAAGTGILLNNELDDFSAKPGTPNAYGLVGGEANAIAPGKRPLSSMTPTFLMRDGKPFLVTGSPGGSRIITTVLQIVLNVVDHGMNVAAATAAPRAHHQWLPDRLRLEVGFSPDTLRLLAGRGHRVVIGDAMGATQTIRIGDDGFYGAADPRRPDGLALGY
ncbi:MAG: gamma-glutamyltransferase [Acidobacteria bacterium]|nr:MAG: gamma-glutamyltransferase [Acidobacteriota bacterium]